MDPFDELKNKLLDGGRCICDVCGKKKKMGGIRINKKAKRVVVICCDCNLEILAERDGITKKEAERRRKKMFAVSYIFQGEKMKEYLAVKGKKNFDSLEEANRVLKKIMDAWNSNLTIKQRKAFEEKEEDELREVFKSIKVFK